LRMHEEGLSVDAAVDAVIQDNLFGLELDPRCTQIAAFNVAVAAWKLTGPRPLPAMKNIACTGLSVGVPREQWMKALESDGTTNLKFYFGQLYDMFSNASTLGSLINPNRFLGSHTLKKEDMDRLFRSLEAVIGSDPTTSPEQHELGVAAQGLAKAAELLAAHYHLVLTNVPYLGRGKHDTILKEHIDTYYDRGKADLGTAFLLRCFEFSQKNCAISVVSPQNWWFLTSYSQLREWCLTETSFLVLATLGEEAWQAFADRGPVATLSVIVSREPTPNEVSFGINALPCRTIDEKMHCLGTVQLSVILQSDLLHNPDHIITVEEVIKGTLLSRYADALQGVSPADFPHYGRCFWEISLGGDWKPWQSAVEQTKPYGGRSLALWWNSDLDAAFTAGKGGFAVCGNQMASSGVT